MSTSYQEPHDQGIAPLHDPLFHAIAVRHLIADFGAERQELGTDFSVKAK